MNGHDSDDEAAITRMLPPVQAAPEPRRGHHVATSWWRAGIDGTCRWVGTHQGASVSMVGCVAALAMLGGYLAGQDAHREPPAPPAAEATESPIGRLQAPTPPPTPPRTRPKPPAPVAPVVKPRPRRTREPSPTQAPSSAKPAPTTTATTSATATPTPSPSPTTELPNPPPKIPTGTNPQ